MADDPIGYEYPCSGCRHMIDGALPGTFSCGWTVTLPLGFRFGPSSNTDRPRKGLTGPFLDNHLKLTCQVREPANDQ